MIVDIRDIPNDAALEADVCIVGAGAAGIVLARDLAASPLRVILLESGGLRREADVQDLYSGESVGERYFEKLHECRSRFFGGSTNCWAGICTPLNSIDFEKRSWVPWSGWPVSRNDLAGYMRKAHDICGTGPYLYDARAWELMRLPDLGFRPEWFQKFVWHFNNRSTTFLRFGRRFRAEIHAAPNVRLLLRTNVVELLTNESGKSVDRARIRTLDGRTGQVRAKVFVLACGAIENARILLASSGRHPNGLGNHRDLVGRFFNEHLQVACAMLQVPEGGGPAVLLSRLSRLGSAFCLPGLVLTPEAQESYRTLNASLAVDPFNDPEGGWLALQNLRSDLRKGQVHPQALSQIWRVLRDSPKLVPDLWRRIAHGERPRGDSRNFFLYARAEQSPNPDSRVTLSDEVDALGVRRARLDWRTLPIDHRAIRLLATFAVGEFQRLGLGRVTQADWLADDEWPLDLVGGPHHMGTTRMSDDDTSGVVDRNCRVHGLHGLYIAGSSVFPTGGHANPTLTIIALTLRLAEQIRQSFDENVTVLETVRLQKPTQAQVISGTP